MDLNELWVQMLQSMQQRMDRRDIDIWLKPCRPMRFDGRSFFVEAPNQYYIDWILGNYVDALAAGVADVMKADIRVEVVVRDESGPSSDPNTSFFEQTDVHSSAEARGQGVNTRQTFASFVVGECNKFAHAAARAVAEKPAQTGYNPLFIYGATGLGKTHLMHAIANELLAQDPTAKVVYATSEEFVNEVIQGIRNNRMEALRSKYRKQATVLLVDDIQFLANKDRTQEEFFHTINALQNAGRQVVISSDKTPREIEKLEPRLRTRFEGGLLADLSAPDKETLLAILYQKAEALSLYIPPLVADAIAQQVLGNIRELEGILHRLAALQSFYREPLTLEFVRRKLPDLFAPSNVQITVGVVIEAVARYHNLKNADLTGGRRTRTLTRPRHIAMYLARKHTALSFPELGREFGNRDHSTIQYGVKLIEETSHTNPDLGYILRLIEQSLQLRNH